MSDPEGQTSEGGLGKDGTIPNSDKGIAAGYQPGGSHFEPEEDGPLEDADEENADLDDEDNETAGLDDL
jgi:hypothetical protein